MSFNFALILFWLLVFTGVIWFADLLFFKKRRAAAARAALARFDANAPLRTNLPEATLREERENLRQRNLRQPGWIEFPASFFPVILVVFVLRSFLFEPFRIPSGSMIPTLLIGDLILVNKFDYGIRLPIINKKIIPVGEPKRGDVMVFRYPLDPSVDYVKRVIGLPGDKISYRNKRLEVNGVAVPTMPLAEEFFDRDRVSYTKQFVEKLPRNGETREHRILNDATSMAMNPEIFPFRENCSYTDSGLALSCVVPAGHYFMMGDNRDNSMDSRFWGFVPDRNIVGRAFYIWMNFGSISHIVSRIGSIQ